MAAPPRPAPTARRRSRPSRPPRCRCREAGGAGGEAGAAGEALPLVVFLCANHGSSAAGGGEAAFLCADCCEGGAGCDGAARVAVEGFSGCPSAAELTASCGLDLRGAGAGCGGDDEGEGDADEDDAFFSVLDYSMLGADPDLRDLYVPCDLPEVAASAGGAGRLKGEALCDQLAEMVRREADTSHPQAHSD